MLLYIRKKRHAMICFEQQEDAEAMVNYFLEYPGELFGSRLSIEYSDHHDLSFPSMSRGVMHTQTILKRAYELKKIAMDGSPGSVLRITVRSGCSLTLSMELLYKLFAEFGIVLKIVISKKSFSKEAFVQMRNAESARKAITALASSTREGFGKLDVNLAREQCLNIKFNNTRSRDFTNPTLPSSPDMDPQSLIALSANANIAESRDLSIGQIRRLIGIDYDRSPSPLSGSAGGSHTRNPTDRGRRPFTFDDGSSSMYDPLDEMLFAKRRRSGFAPSIADGLQQCSSLFGSDDLNNSATRQRHISPSSSNIIPGITKEDLIDQLLVMSSRNPQSSSAVLAESLTAGRLDANAIAAAKQILAERAMNAISQDPYAKLLNILISSNGNNGGSGMTSRGSEYSLDPLTGGTRESPRFSGDRRSGRAGFSPQHQDDHFMDNSRASRRDEFRPSKVLLVSNLNAERINPDALFTLFGVYGDVERVKVMFTKSGSALVQMASEEQALQAIHFLNGIVIYNKRMRIISSKYNRVQVARDGLEGEQWSRSYEDSPLHRYSRPGSRNCMNIYPPSEHLHLSNISDETDREEIQEIFSKYGAIRNIRFFFTDRRMGVVEMESISSACEALIGAHNILLRCNRRLRISFAKPKF